MTRLAIPVALITVGLTPLSGAAQLAAATLPSGWDTRVSSRWTLPPGGWTPP